MTFEPLGIYRIVDGSVLNAHITATSNAHPASAITYDNTGSGVSSENIQDAISELALRSVAGAGGFAANLYFTRNASDVSGYYKMSYENDLTELETSGTVINGEVLAASYVFDLPINATNVPAGLWVGNFRSKVSSTVGISRFKVEVFLYHEDETETVLFTHYTDEINNTDYQNFKTETSQPGFACDITDRLGIKVYRVTTSASAITFYSILGDGNASYFTTPLQFRHNLLRSRGEADAHPASAISLDDTDFTGNLSGVTDVQSMAAIVDDFSSSEYSLIQTVTTVDGVLSVEFTGLSGEYMLVWRDMFSYNPSSLCVLQMQARDAENNQQVVWQCAMLLLSTNATTRLSGNSVSPPIQATYQSLPTKLTTDGNNFIQLGGSGRAFLHNLGTSGKYHADVHGAVTDANSSEWIISNYGSYTLSPYAVSKIRIVGSVSAERPFASGGVVELWRRN